MRLGSVSARQAPSIKYAMTSSVTRVFSANGTRITRENQPKKHISNASRAIGDKDALDERKRGEQKIKMIHLVREVCSEQLDHANFYQRVYSPAEQLHRKISSTGQV